MTAVFPPANTAKPQKVELRIHLTDGHTWQTRLSSDSSLLHDLFAALAANRTHTGAVRLFHLPLSSGTATCSFLSSQLVSIDTTPPILNVETHPTLAAARSTQKFSGPSQTAAPRTRPYVVNVGLPRTGTTSFAHATERLGFRALHGWHQAEHHVATLAQCLRNAAESRQFIDQYDTLSDTPFYGLRGTFGRYYPQAHIIFTTRPKHDWVDSMIRHRAAGGQFLAQLYGLNGPPYTQAQAADLAAVYDHHHQTVCAGLPAIDLSCRDDWRKWEVLCAGLPTPEAYLARSAGYPWPHENKSSRE